MKQMYLFLLAIFILMTLVACDNNIDETISNIEEVVATTEEVKDTNILYSKLPEVVDEISKFSDDDVINVLQDEKISDVTKQIIIEQLPQINDGSGIKDQPAFIEILENKQIKDSYRIKIIHSLNFDDIDDIDILENIVCSENSAVTTNAMRKILRLSPKTALKTSNKIIDNSIDYGEYQIKSAVMIKSYYLRDASVNSFNDVSLSEIDSFISFCMHQYNESNNETFKNAMLFSLMDINHIGAVRTIIFNKDIDDMLKTACVVRNYQTFLNILDKEVSNEDVNCIIEAMKISPIKEIGFLLKENVLSDELYNNSELDEVVDKIISNGSAANMKWVQTKQKYVW